VKNLATEGTEKRQITAETFDPVWNPLLIE